MPEKITSHTINSLVAENNTSEAIEKLTSLLKGSIYEQDIFLIQTRNNALRNKMRNGVISQEERTRQENEINESVVNLARDVFDSNLKWDVKRQRLEMMNNNDWIENKILRKDMIIMACITLGLFVLGVIYLIYFT